MADETNADDFLYIGYQDLGRLYFKCRNLFLKGKYHDVDGYVATLETMVYDFLNEFKTDVASAPPLGTMTSVTQSAIDDLEKDIDSISLPSSIPDYPAPRDEGL